MKNKNKINLNFDGKRYSLGGGKSGLDEKIVVETLNCMAKKSLNQLVKEPIDAVGYAMVLTENATILNSIHEQLDIPMLSDVIDYTGTISVPVVFEDIECEVEMRKAECKPYVLIEVKNKDYLFGNYAVGFNGEFLLGDVVDDVSEEDIDSEEFLEYYIDERDDEFSLFVIVKAMDKIKKQILEKLKNYQKIR